VLAGQSVDHKKHIHTRLGAPIAHIVKGHNRDNDLRYIVGGVFKGYTQTEETYLGLYETSLTLIPDGREKEFFGFLRPGFSKSSFSRTFLSVFNTSEVKMDCSLHGEERACINCGYCSKVCPVDILPQFTLRVMKIIKNIFDKNRHHFATGGKFEKQTFSTKTGIILPRVENSKSSSRFLRQQRPFSLFPESRR